jgi:chemotaxis signal transduction protein
MLHDSLPRNEKGAVPPGCFGIFADRQRRVIASTSSALAVGSKVPLDEAFLGLSNGEGYANIVEFDGQYFAIGSKMSRGYREFKGPQDLYQTDIAALVFIPLGAVQSVTSAPMQRDQKRVPHASLTLSGVESTEIATFYIGDEWFGIPSLQVVEAINATGISPMPGMPPYVRGVLMYKHNPLLIFDLRSHLHFSKPADPAGFSQIIVVRGRSEEPVGILVSRLGEVPEISNTEIESVANLFPGQNGLSESVVKANPSIGRDRILVVLSAERIRAKLIRACENSSTSRTVVVA